MTETKRAAVPGAAATAADSRPQKRQSISGMIVTIILIGIVVSIGGILATTTTDMVQTGLVLDAVEIKRLAIQNAGTQSYITGMIKNAGNTDVTDVQVIVRLGAAAGYDGTDDDDDEIFVASFSPATVNSGVSATINAEITGDTGLACAPGADGAYECTGTSADEAPIRLTIGEKYQVEVSALIAGGGQYSQTKVLSPQ